MCECKSGFSLNSEACVQGIYYLNSSPSNRALWVGLSKPSFFSECQQPTDCPNNGLNYECNGNLCECSDGFALNGETCDSLGGNLCSS